MFQGWWVVGTHFTVQLFIVGFFTYSYPLLFGPVSASFETDVKTMNYLPTLAGLLGLGLAPLAGPLVDKWSAKGLMLIGAVCMVVGLLGMSFSQSILEFTIVGGLFLGAANVLLGPMTGSAVISRWFTSSRGMALGVAAIGTSIGGMVMPLVVADAVETDWRTGLQRIALVAAVIVIPLLLLRFWNHPSDHGMEAEPMPGGSSGAAGDSEAPATTSEILGRPAFWLFTGSLSLMLACYTSTLTNLGQYQVDLGIEAADTKWIFTLLATAGIGGKLTFGYLADRIPLKLGLAVAIIATATAIYLFSLEPAYPVVLAGGVALGIASGGILPVWNAMVPAIFGVANYGRTMGLMSPVIGLTVTPSFALVGALRDSTGSYVLGFQICIGVLMVSLALLAPLQVKGVDSVD
jgi:MFS family permease